MAQTVALPDELYQMLANEATDAGVRVDDFVARLLCQARSRRPDDPLFRPVASPLVEYSDDESSAAVKGGLSVEDYRFWREFCGTWQAAPGLNVAELVRSHDD